MCIICVLFVECVAPYTLSGSSCLYIGPQISNWNLAKASCEGLSPAGHLVMVKTQQTQQDVASFTGGEIHALHSYKLLAIQQSKSLGVSSITKVRPTPIAMKHAEGSNLGGKLKGMPALEEKNKPKKFLEIDKTYSEIYKPKKILGMHSH